VNRDHTIVATDGDSGRLAAYFEGSAFTPARARYGRLSEVQPILMFLKLGERSSCDGSQAALVGVVPADMFPPSEGAR
jgi:hypothetical protein